MSSSNYLLNAQEKFRKFPMGQALFSRAFASKAPYFKSIKPSIEKLEPNFCQVKIKKHKAIHNHIGTVHAIAICNALEMAMGAMVEASIPKHLRWLPKGINVNYIAKAETDIIAEAKIDPEAWHIGDVEVSVRAMDQMGKVVVEGIIPLWVTEKTRK